MRGSVLSRLIVVETTQRAVDHNIPHVISGLDLAIHAACQQGPTGSSPVVTMGGRGRGMRKRACASVTRHGPACGVTG
jgi:hypothetical protein